MNPADEAQVEQYKYNAREARRQAGLLMGDVTTNALRFNEQAEQSLSQGVALLGKTGSLSFEKSEAPSTGVDVGTVEGPEVAELRARVAAAQKELEEAPETTINDEGSEVPYDTSELEANLADLQSQLTTLTSAGQVPTITGPESLLYASGSDLLTLTSLRDKMERDKRALIRKGQSEAYTMLLAGENYSEQAGYAREAGQYNMWSSILGGGLRLAGAAARFGLFGGS